MNMSLKSKLARVYAYSLMSELAVYTPYMVLFLSHDKNFVTSRTLMFFGAYSLSLLLFEIPSGFIADSLGARKTLILGTLVRLSSVVLLYFLGGEWLLLSQAVLAFGQALRSGADQAYFYRFHGEYLKDHKPLQNFKEFNSKISTFVWTGITAAFLLGTLFSRISYNAVVIATGVSFAVCFLLTFSLPLISGWDSIRRKNLIKICFEELSTNRRGRKWFILSSITMGIVYTAYSLAGPLLNERGFSGPNNGIIYFAVTLFAVLGAKIHPWLTRKRATIKMLLIVFPLLSLLLFLFRPSAGHFITLLLIFCVFRLFFGLLETCFFYEINSTIEHDEIRSTVFSGVSLVTGFISGILLLFFSEFSIKLETGFLILSVVVLILSILLPIAARRKTSGLQPENYPEA